MRLKIKIINVLFIFLLFTSCAEDKQPETTIIKEINSTSYPVYITETSKLEGYFTLPNNGYIELLKTYDNRVVIYSIRIQTENLDQTLTLHPNIAQGPHSIKTNDCINGIANFNYNNSNNLKNSSNVVITGNRSTYFSICHSSKLTINLKIYSSDGSTIEVNRTIESL